MPHIEINVCLYLFIFCSIFILKFICIYIPLIPFSISTGLITTTARKLDRENQPEHILEVNDLFGLNEWYICVVCVKTKTKRKKKTFYSCPTI